MKKSLHHKPSKELENRCYKILLETWGRATVLYPNLDKNYPDHGYKFNIKFFRKSAMAGYVMQGNFVDVYLNADFLENETEDFLARTVPHELAHIIDEMLWGMQYTRNGRRILHGATWKKIMRDLDLDDSTYHSYDVSKSSRVRSFIWKNRKGEEMVLGPIRHKKQLKREPGRGYYMRDHSDRFYTFTGEVR